MKREMRRDKRIGFLDCNFSNKYIDKSKIPVYNKSEQGATDRRFALKLVYLKQPP